MLYSPVSSKGLVTIPKPAREFLELIPGKDALILTPVSGNSIVISKHNPDDDAGLTKPIKLTKKGQFTISGKYHDWVKLNEDSEVYFSISNDQLILGKAGKLKNCLPCQTSGLIHGIECCICKGTCKTRENPAGILAEIFIALKDGRKYGIEYSLINHELLSDGKVVITDLPKFKVGSSTKPAEYVAAIQEHYEKCIKEEYSKLNHYGVDVLEM